jgi:hypothetical protein
MFSFYTYTIPENPNSHISDDPLDSQTIILKQFLQKKKSESYFHTAQAMWTKFTAWKHKGNITNAFSAVQL